MKKTVSMKDIARQVGVSIVTVSKALSSKDGVGDVLRAKIIETAGELGYRYKQQDRSLTATGYTVGVLVAHRFLGPNNGFYWDVYQNVCRQLAKFQGCAIMEEVQPEQERDCKPPNLLLGRQIDGLILLGQIRNEYTEKMMHLGLPVLLLDFYDRHIKADAVITDNIYGSYNMTNYLIEHGHKAIAFVGSVHNTSSILDRYVGYYKAMLEADLPIRDEWVIPDRDDKGNIFVDFTLPEQMPTAFVCNCDETAYRFIQYLNAQKFRVPEDVSIVSFDNYIFSSISKPAITTMKVDMHGMAELAVKCIMKKIANPSVAVGRRMVDGHIIQRDSVKTLV